MNKTLTTCLCVLPLCGHALTPLYQGSHVIKATPYLWASNTAHDEAIETISHLSHPDYRFPVKSELTPGVVSDMALSMDDLSFPFFVVGADTYSLHWLDAQCKDLKALNALGLVTNIDTEVQLHAVEKVCDMTFLPVDLTDFSKELPIAHYPFLVSHQGIEQ